MTPSTAPASCENSGQSNIKSEGVVAFAMFAVSFIIRPMLFGQNYTIIGSLLMFALGCLSSFQFGASNSLLRRNAAIALTILLLWAFLCVHSVLNGVPEPFALYTLVNFILCLTGSALAFANVTVQSCFFRYFRNFFAASAVSILITLLLARNGGVERYLIYSIDVAGYVDLNIGLYAPFTLGYGVVDYGPFTMTRLGTGFREAGIAQAFIAASIISFPLLRGQRNIIVFGLLVLSGVATQSTVGIGMTGVAVVLRMAVDRHNSPSVKGVTIAMAAVAAAFALSFAANDESLGLENKLTTDSYWDRKLQTDLGLQIFYDHPFGIGSYAPGAPGINLLSSLGAIGVVGVGLLVCVVAVSTLTSKYKLRKFAYLFPFIITALFSEPLLDAPLMFVFFLLEFEPDADFHRYPRRQSAQRFRGKRARSVATISRTSFI